MGVKCRLVYVGSGTARVRSVGLDSRSTEEERRFSRSKTAELNSLATFCHGKRKLFPATAEFKHEKYGGFYVEILGLDH